MKPARNLDSATIKDTDGRENQFNVVKALVANEKRSDTRPPRKYIFTFRRRWRPHRASVCVFSGLSSPDATYEYFPEEKKTKRQPGPERIALQNEFRVFAVVAWLVNSTAIPSYLVSFHTVPSTNRLLVSRPFEQRNTNTKMSGRRFQSELCRTILLYLYILFCNERCTWLVGAFIFVN